MGKADDKIIKTTAQLLFVTDPLCSWCWGMLPEVVKLRQIFEPEVEFNLMLAGLQVGNKKPNDIDKQRLLNIWSEVVNVTGQKISGKLPKDPEFIYHSEIPCRAVKIVQFYQPDLTWDFFTRLQEAFYVEGNNITSVNSLAQLANECGFQKDIPSLIQDHDIVTATREDFITAKQLGAHALPSLLLDTGEGLRLIAGGYTAAEYLVDMIEARLQAK